MAWKNFLILLGFLALLAGSVVFVYFNYSKLFAKTVDGRVVGINKVSMEEEFVVAIRGADQVIDTAKTDDPRWALIAPGQCVIAKFFPHPPWDLEFRGTFFQAKLISIHDCRPDQAAPVGK